MSGNIAQFFSRHLTRPTHALFRHRVDGAWRDVTVEEVVALVRRWQAAFRRDGYAAGDRVAICARSCARDSRRRATPCMRTRREQPTRPGSLVKFTSRTLTRCHPE
jgi:acyl-CoA synthetase (AMP-forming)/AMP-acid ligase II